MTPQARAIIREVAEERGVDPDLIVTPCRRHHVFRARVEVARRLDARGYSTCRIGALLNHDHTTIVFYLGRGKKKPSERVMAPPRKRVWKPPVVRHLRWLVRPSKQFLRPYAGADMREYVWQERSCLIAAKD